MVCTSSSTTTWPRRSTSCTTKSVYLCFSTPRMRGPGRTWLVAPTSASHVAHGMGTRETWDVTAWTMEDASTTCVAVLCGLPGAGKSALADGWKDEDVHVASVDGAVGRRGDWDVAAWKPARRAVKREVREWLERYQGKEEEKHVIVVDDNMHLRSMRKEYFRIAREHRACYVQVFVDVPCEVALERNRRRVEEQRVPDQVVLDMHERFERPKPDKYTWEQNTLVVKGHDVDWMHEGEEHARICQQTYQALLEMWKHASPPPTSNAERLDMQERSRMGNRESAAHVVDLRARKIVSETLQEVSRAHRRELAISLANAKRELLSTLEDQDWDAMRIEPSLSAFRDTCKHLLARPSVVLLQGSDVQS
mmetsp:Transcript_1186/g.7749  ORF Transcript_1186/g.7749 Transcript_1186/m.7749 type:complete len:365 (+) Transcript_1186:2555-3649(+)